MTRRPVITMPPTPPPPPSYAYKATSRDGTAVHGKRRIQYRVGQTYEETFDESILCVRGLHASRQLNDVFRYYPRTSDWRNRWMYYDPPVFLVEILGHVDEGHDKLATTRLRVVQRVSMAWSLPHFTYRGVKTYTTDMIESDGFYLHVGYMWLIMPLIAIMSYLFVGCADVPSDATTTTSEVVAEVSTWIGWMLIFMMISFKWSDERPSFVDQPMLLTFVVSVVVVVVVSCHRHSPLCAVLLTASIVGVVEFERTFQARQWIRQCIAHMTSILGYRSMSAVIVWVMVLGWWIDSVATEGVRHRVIEAAARGIFT